MEKLIDKINLFRGLSKEEKEKLVRNFLPSLSLVTKEEIATMLSSLEQYGIKITKAVNVKDIVNEISKVRGGIALLESVDAVDIYQIDPSKLSLSAFDISRRIKMCKDKGIEYKDVDGSYKEFVFNESEFNRIVENAKNAVNTTNSDYQFNDNVSPVDNEDFKKQIAGEFDDSIKDDITSLGEQIGNLKDATAELTNNDEDTVSFDAIDSILKGDWARTRGGRAA